MAGPSGSTAGWVLWLLLSGCFLSAAAQQQCTEACGADADPVCAADGRSYMNECIARCAGLQVQHTGYCEGEKLQFLRPGRPAAAGSSSSSGQPGANWRLARESAAVVTPDTMSRFAADGFVYRGRIALSRLPMYVRESSAGLDAVALLDELQAADQGGPSDLEIAIIRVDSAGQLYTKTYTYNPKRFLTTSYPPSNPGVYPTAGAPPPPGTSVAAAAAAAKGPSAPTPIPIPQATSLPGKLLPGAAATPSINGAAASGGLGAVTQLPVPTAAPGIVPVGAGPTAAGVPVSAAGGVITSSLITGRPAPAPAPAVAASPSPQPGSSRQQAPPSSPSSSPAAPPPVVAGSVRPSPLPQVARSSSSSSSGAPSSSSSSSKQTAAPGAAGADFFSMVAWPDAGPGGDTTGPAAAASSSGSSGSGSSAGSSSSWGDGSSSSSSSSSGLRGSGRVGSDLDEVLTPEMGSYDQQQHAHSSSSGTPAAAAAQQQPGQQRQPGQQQQQQVAAVVADAEGVTTATFPVDEAAAAEQQDHSSNDSSSGCPPGAVWSCADAVTSISPAFGSKTAVSKWVDHHERLVGSARIIGITAYYNKTSACLRGLALTYSHSSSSSGGGRQQQQQAGGSEVVLLGSAVGSHPSVAVKSLQLGPGEVVDHAELAAPRCVAALKLTTSKGRQLVVGQAAAAAAAAAGQQLAVSARGRADGLLLAVRGFQDKPVVKNAATADKPAVTMPGVLKQLQLVWGAPACSCSTPAAAGLAQPGSSGGSSAAYRLPAASAAAAAGRRLAQLEEQLETQAPPLPDAAPGLVRLGTQQYSLHRRKLNQQLRREQLQAVGLEPAAAGDVAADGLAAAGVSGGADDAADYAGWDDGSELYDEDADDDIDQRWKADADGDEDDDDDDDDEQEPARSSGRTVPRSGRATAAALRLRLSQLLAHASLGLDGNMPAAAEGAALHRMLSVISPDERAECPVLTYPFTTLGQINAKAADGGFICSGGLIGPDRVLTAGHCVWDDRDTQGPFGNLSFSPAQYKRDGKVTAPLGQVAWDYVTLFEAYVNDPDGAGLAYDVAVITLREQVGSRLGWLGIRSDVAPCRMAPLLLSLAGYPGDDPATPRPGGWQGGCFVTNCSVNFSCSVSITNHTCDSFVGQSGAPMYDRDFYVRAVHTLGVLPGFSTSNGAITIQKFILDNVMGYWKLGDGFSRAPPPSADGGGFGAAAAADYQRRRRLR